jgi:hypothetical protein
MSLDWLEPELTLDWKKRTLEPISAETVGRYQTLLTPEEKRHFSDVANQALIRFGYKA